MTGRCRRRTRCRVPRPAARRRSGALPAPPPGGAPPTRRQYAYGLAIALVVLVLFVLGIFG